MSRRGKIFLVILAVLTCLCTACTTKTNPPSAAPITPAASSQQDASSAAPSDDEPLPQPALDPQALASSWAEETAKAMSLEALVGQLFFVRHPDQNALEDLAEYQFGGYLFFARDFENQTPDSFRALVHEYQQKSSLPLLLGVDEEGGNVVRVSKFSAFRSEPFPSAQTLFASGGYDAISDDAAEKSQFLKALGLNVNFAPVCDISTDPADYIYSRAFGQDAEGTSQYVFCVVSAMKEAQIGDVLKHFPGYGQNTDTHTNVAYDHRSLDELRQNDLRPFAAGIAAGADSVLVSHNVICAVDETMPGSLSAPVHDLLRQELGFEGVILTDDLAMAGSSGFSDENAAVLAFQAGNDMVVTTDYKTDIPAVVQAVQDGRLSRSTLEQHAQRVLIWKIHLGLIDPDTFES